MISSRIYLWSLAVIALGCGPSNKEAEPAKAPVANPANSEPGTPIAAERSAAAEPVKVGDKIKCPVSDEEFTVAENSPRVTHEGRDYYLCCASCAESFKADPTKYAK
jgi:YHS domain-containing protein